MVEFESFTFDFTQWQTWVMLTAGACISGLIFLGGRSLVRTWMPVTIASARAFLGEERRRWPRSRRKIAGVLISDAKLVNVPRRALLLDRSVGGVRLSVDAPVKVGTVLSIRSPKSTADGAWVQMQVVRCQAVDRGWELGCMFLQPQPLEP